jgi:hypothetical protein
MISTKYWCGVAPIRIETGRYERLNVTDRICKICDNHDNEIEDEKHGRNKNIFMNLSINQNHLYHLYKKLLRQAKIS